MKKGYLTFILLILIFNFSSAQELKKEYQEVVQTFIDYIENRNMEKLKAIVNYPLRREYPLSDIKNESEFVKRDTYVFDDSLTKMIVNSDLKNDWSAVGWRGIMLNNGALWLDYDGRLIAVNYQSNFERDKRVELIENDKNSIHESIRDFEEPILIMETEKFKIRIDKLSNGKYRYTTWSINSKMNEKPDLILKKGTWIPEGSGGNHRYEFVNGNYKYVCSINILGADDTPPADLIVNKNDNEILNEPAQIIRK